MNKIGAFSFIVLVYMKYTIRDVTIRGVSINLTKNRTNILFELLLR